MRIRKMPVQRKSVRSFRPAQKSERWKRMNWPFWIGGTITILFIVLAIQGPKWAPKNPMQENYTLAPNGVIRTPPYSPLTVPGYPLGTDGNGRDLLSRILWGVRPTLIMVASVAFFRLALGILIGLIVGWAQGRFAESLDVGLSWALSVPVLIVALCGITLVGIYQGLPAFIFGLALNGWAETARFVSGQVRIIKGQAYIEACQALGAGNLRIFVSHVLRQVLPYVWMLLAFEISGTLLVASELGFLGYYIGGGVWVEVSDFSAVNVAGLPELGQLLSTALVKLTNPSALVVVGITVFMAILGFNLLGEGLRIETDPQRRQKASFSIPVISRVRIWFNETISEPVFYWIENHLIVTGGVILLLVGSVIGLRWRAGQPTMAPINISGAEVKIPGGNQWATEWRDAQGTLWSYKPGPNSSHLLWTYPISSTLVGGPVVMADGTLILPQKDLTLSAIRPDGTTLWQTRLPEEPVGAPGLGPNGEIYITDAQGGLSAFSPSGGLLWRATSPNGREATSGPVVSSRGVIYFTAVDVIEAFRPDGQLLWQTYGADSYTQIPPRLSAGETFIFLKGNGFAADNGVSQNFAQFFTAQTTHLFTDDAFVIGADSGSYFRQGHSLFPWRSTDMGFQVDPEITWDYRTSVMQLPTSGGAAPDGSVWLWYTSLTEDARLVWIRSNGDVISNARLGERQARLMGFDQAGTAYICTSSFGTAVSHCFTLPRGAKKPGWNISFGYGTIAGGALVDHRIYVALEYGLYAIGDE